MEVLTAFIELFIISAPWLLLGLFIAGAINVYIPADFLQRQLGDEKFSTIVKAAVIGAPLPLCSCGVIPAAMGLRKAGASKASTASFLVATPETGVDSVSMSYALLGPFMAIARPISAVISAIVTGVLTHFFERNDNHSTPIKDAQQSPCCAPKVEEPQEKKSCCAKSAKAQELSVVSETPKWLRVWEFASVTMLKDIAKWLLIGLVVAAVMTTYVPKDFMTQYGQGWSAMLLMVVIGVPMYICATASTPIAAGLMLSGVSPGAVLVFMLAGPATNLATIGVVRKELGNRSLMAYLIGVIGSALVAGYFTDWLIANEQISVVAMLGHEHDVLSPIVTLGSGVILAAMLANIYILKPILKSSSSH